eukprot:TRINITY_DN6834_c0_g1_i1.p1 TRINITY_DN6834_c0_g1~~TRINITY_DN6834_c0_g1_i1.p1  ORF type:complete len:263 (+),score=72.92 TRINITY_DN6834_c0_g1_i1:91-879(+)
MCTLVSPVFQTLYSIVLTLVLYFSPALQSANGLGSKTCDVILDAYNLQDRDEDKESEEQERTRLHDGAQRLGKDARALLESITARWLLDENETRKIEDGITALMDLEQEASNSSITPHLDEFFDLLKPLVALEKCFPLDAIKTQWEAVQNTDGSLPSAKFGALVASVLQQWLAQQPASVMQCYKFFEAADLALEKEELLVKYGIPADTDRVCETRLEVRSKDDRDKDELVEILTNFALRPEWDADYVCVVPAGASDDEEDES